MHPDPVALTPDLGSGAKWGAWQWRWLCLRYLGHPPHLKHHGNVDLRSLHFVAAKMVPGCYALSVQVEVPPDIKEIMAENGRRVHESG